MAREDKKQNDGYHGNGIMYIFVNGMRLVPLNTAACPEVFVTSDVAFVLGHLDSSAVVPTGGRKGVAGVLTSMKKIDDSNSGSSTSKKKLKGDEYLVSSSSPATSRQQTSTPTSLYNRFADGASTETRYFTHVVNFFTNLECAAFPSCVRIHVASVLRVRERGIVAGTVLTASGCTA